MATGETPTLPPVPPEQTTVEEQSLEEARIATRSGKGMWAALWGALWAAVVDGLSVVITGLIRVVDKLFALLGQFIKKGQGEENPEFWELVASIITDLTGVEVDAEALKAARFGGGRLDAMAATGATIFDLLGQEFLAEEGQEIGAKLGPAASPGSSALPDGTLSPEQGVRAAKRFLGFAMSFAVRAGNVS